MPHLPARAARPFNLHGVTFNAFAGSAAGATELAAWRTDFPPHTPGQPHSMSAEEVMLVLTGELELELAGEPVTARAGDAVLVPAGATLRVTNATDHAASAWLVTRLGMRARMAGGDEIAPPWAQ